MMDNCCAPQWADFTSSPQILTESYFEMEHEVHEPQINLKPTKSRVSLPSKFGNITEVAGICEESDNNSKSMRRTPAKVGYFVPFDNKQSVVKETVNDNISQQATINIKLNDKSHKIRQTWNISVQEFTSHAFKTPTGVHKMKTAATEKVRSIHKTEQKNLLSNTSTSKFLKANNDLNRKEATQMNVTQDKIDSTMNYDIDESENHDKVDFTQKRLSYKIGPVQRRLSNMFNGRRSSLGKSQPKVLTCQYRRRSLLKYRRRSKQFVSLAEAVSKFQNGTPERFRTLSNKDMKPGPLSKLKQGQLKLTKPVSPMLRCKQRTRKTTVLSQAERELQELEEMKKNQIKAKPVPTNILKAPTALKKVAKKPITVTEEFRLTKPIKPRHTINVIAVHAVESKEPQNSKNRAQDHKNMTSITKKDDNLCIEEPADSNVKSVMHTVPFAFDLRNKEFQVRKEQKLKSLQTQETGKVKVEFHARPVPNFTKSVNTIKNHSVKKVVPCPFSFEERDKCLAKKKQEHIKQLKEENKEVRVFHANPVPSFKPVTVHGLSKENLRMKEKVAEPIKKPMRRQTRSCFGQENKQPNIANNKTCLDSKENDDRKRYIVDNETDKKQTKNILNTVDNNGKANANQKKSVPLKIVHSELKTDKRAKERCEFDEKLRRKEQDGETKRHEEEQNKLQREKMERAELRKMAEVKARPMPVFKPMQILKSSKAPTSPKSPAWASKSKPKRAVSSSSIHTTKT